MESLATIGKFLVLQELGHGGMGAVFIGYESEFRRLVVIKTLFEQFSKEENWIKRFLREAEVYRKLDHPNIVKFIDAGDDNGTNFIAMEYIRSRPLDEVIKKSGKLPVDATVKIMGHLTDAISLAHEKGIIHRDLKPANIMYSEDGVVKLIDFGIAFTEDELIKTQEGTILGTFQYAAPEQNQGKKVDERSDLYALGAIWYEMLCGKRATAGSSLLEVIKAQITGGIIQPSVHNPEVPKGLEKMILKLLDKDPNNRYRNGKELIFDIQKYKEDPKGFDPQRMFDDEVTAKQFEKGKEALIKGNIDLALDMLKSVAQAKPDSAEIQIHLGKAYTEKKFKKPALDAFKKALALEPEKVEYLLDYANSLYKLRAYDEADVEIKKALDLEPDNMYVVNASKKIAQAKENPPPIDAPAAAPSRPTGKSPIIAQTPQSKSGIYDKRPTQTTPSLTKEAVADAFKPTGAGAPPTLLERFLWFVNHFRNGSPIRGLLLAALWLFIMGSLLFAARWPRMEINFHETSLHVQNKTASQLFSLWHTQKYDFLLQRFLNGAARWVTVCLAVGLFLLMGVKAPRYTGANGSNDGPSGAPSTAATG